MKTISNHILVLFTLCIILVGCQNLDDKKVMNNAEKAEVTLKEIEIEGVADHYHTGDRIELFAKLHEETQYTHWQWYQRQDEQSEWETVSGQETSRFTEQSIHEELEIKVVLFNDDNEIYAESSPVTIVIEDHHIHSEEEMEIYRGYFSDDQVKERDLSDWEGDWQSVYPYVLDGKLDEVFEFKAENGDMSAKEYKEYYTEGYKTDVERITIKDNVVTFFTNEQPISGTYKNNQYEILEYKAGNRGVRFIFELVEGDDGMPQYIQFSDHNIYPTNSTHFHLYWGDNHEKLLEEMTNWPTYYPYNLNEDDIVHDMLAH